LPHKGTRHFFTDQLGQGNIFIFKVQMLVTSISELNVWNLALSDVAAIFGSDLENKKLDSDFE
jgi:hypothetical protein